MRDGATKLLTPTSIKFPSYTSAVFSPDGSHVAAGCWDGKAYIYNVQAGTLNWWVFGMLLLGILTYLHCVVFSEICLQEETISDLYVSAVTENTWPPVHGMEYSSYASLY